MIEETVNTPGFKINWQPISVSVSKSEDMGYLIEKSEVTVNDASTGKSTTLYGQAVSIWKKDTKGNWKNVVQASFPAPSPNNQKQLTSSL